MAPTGENNPLLFGVSLPDKAVPPLLDTALQPLKQFQVFPPNSSNKRVAIKPCGLHAYLRSDPSPANSYRGPSRDLTTAERAALQPVYTIHCSH